MFPLTPHVNLHCFACLFADSLLLLHEAAFWQSTTMLLQYQHIPNLENHAVNFSGALAMPERYPRDTPFSVPDTQVLINL